MEVDMLVNTGTCNSAQIRAEVESLRFHRLIERAHHIGGCAQDINIFFLREGAHFGRVCVWYDEKVAAVIRVEIHHHKTVGPADENEIAGIIPLAGRFTEEALVIILPFFIGE